MTLTEQMKTLVDKVVSTRDDRSAAAVEFKKEIEHVLNDARACIKETANAHLKMANQLQSDLANNCKDRLKQVQALREHARCQLQETRVRLRQMLEQTKANRNRHVTDLMLSFQQTRRLLAADIQEASHLWQNLQSK